MRFCDRFFAYTFSVKHVKERKFRKIGISARRHSFFSALGSSSLGDAGADRLALSKKYGRRKDGPDLIGLRLTDFKLSLSASLSRLLDIFAVQYFLFRVSELIIPLLASAFKILKEMKIILTIVLLAEILPLALSFVAPHLHVSPRQGGVRPSTPCSSLCLPASAHLSLAMSASSTTDETGSAQEMKTGKVSWFNAFRGFGFITIDGDEGDVYVHQSNISMDGFRKLEEGASVQFQIGIDDSERGGGKAYAFDVTPIGIDEKAADIEDAPESHEVEEVEEVEEAAEAENAGEVEEVSAVHVEESATEPTPVPTPTTADISDESIDEGERAFNILVSLGMVERTPDPDDDEYDSSKDDELAPHKII